MLRSEKPSKGENVMKSALKSVLPQPALNFLRDFRARRSLSQVSVRNFREQSLAANDHIAFEKLLIDQEISEAWERDHNKIAEVFGNKDEFGGVNPGDRRAIYTLIAALRPEKVLEIGTHIGASTLYIACALRHAGKGRVTTVDILDVNDEAAPWRQSGMPASPARNARNLECADVISFMKSLSCDFMKNTKEKYDFIFLDGDHGAGTVYKEMALALEILVPNGLILLHDYYPGGKALFPDGSIIPGPYRALERIRRENARIDVRPLGQLPWQTKQGVKATSLALVTRSIDKHSKNS